MAVYKRTYKPYAGPLTPAWSRFLILTRFSYSRLFQSRFLLMSFASALFYPMGCAAFIYVAHNLTFLTAFNISAGDFMEINGRFFYFFCTVQGAIAYLLTAFVGPSLIAPDLANGALPLYLCRPFSRFEYAAGKMAVLFGLLSAITWIPGLFLFAIQSSLAGRKWAVDNLWMAAAIPVALVSWCIVLSLIALALSAWVKWRVAAGALVLGVYFAGAGLGSAINSVMRTSNGTLIDIVQVAHAAWSNLFRYDSGSDLSPAAAWTVLGIVCALCIWLLARRIRAFEVVK